MTQIVRITTRADLVEVRKQQYIQAGYHIDDEQPALRGMCSFRAVRRVPEDELSNLKDLIWAQAATGKQRLRRMQNRPNGRSRK